MPDVIVKDSKIHGKGVFALRDFKKGEVVIKWDTSHVLTLDQVEKLPKSEKDYVAKRDIKKGEEVGEDYAEDETPGFRMKCNCGSKNCRGLIRKE